MTSSRTLLVASCGGALVVVVIALSLRLRSVDTPSSDKTSKNVADKPLATARAMLAQTADLDRCRAALQQVNAHLRQSGDSPGPQRDAGRRQHLQQQLGLDKGDLAELDSKNFTLLDGHHLDQCFLLRDAAQSLEVHSRAGKRPTVREEAEAAFAWVMRQLQLQSPFAAFAPSAAELAPEFVLRRSFGSPLARALIFLGLLQQLGHDGCLLSFPPSSGKPPRYWACGVRGEDGQIYLFDPRLGMPLPGVAGPVATLAEVREKDSAALRRLNFDKDTHYDVTPEMAAVAEVHLAPSLSALAPRMGYLEKELGPKIKVRLAADAGAEGRFEKALVKGSGKKTVVKLAPWSARLQRSFYPEGDGGVDREGRQQKALRQIFERHLGYLKKALPAAIVPTDSGAWRDPPLNFLVDRFLQPVDALFFKRDQPRDQILRGRFEDASRELGTSHDRLLFHRDRFKASYDPREIQQWFDAASAAIARKQDRADFENLQNRYGKALANLVQGAAAAPRLAQTAFLLAQCRQEQAERLQLRLDAFPKEARARDHQQAEDLWNDVSDAWRQFFDRHADAPMALAARADWARAQEMLGVARRSKASLVPSEDRAKLLTNADVAWESAADSWDELARSWDGLGRGRKVLPALACRFHARRLQHK